MSKPNRAYLLFVFLAIVYLTLVFVLPPNANAIERYNISESQIRIIGLALAAPYSLIWFIAFFGSARLRSYAELIKHSQDGKSILHISDGLLVLAIGLPIAAITGNLLSYVGRTSTDLLPLTVIVGNYIEIMIGLLAMTLIYRGALGLAKMVDPTAETSPSHIVTIGITLIGISFAGFSLSNPARQFPTGGAGTAAYYLPDILIAVTIIVPLLYTWYKGLQSAYYVEKFRRHVRGHIYRSALGYLASGIAFVVLARIALRYLASLNTIVNTWALHYLLIILYCLLILIAVGFGLVAKGSKKLKQLEEV